MRHKVNPHTLRVGVIRDWDSKWNPNDSINIDSFNSTVLNGDKFRNLQITRSFGMHGFNSCDVERFVKAMKKR